MLGIEARRHGEAGDGEAGRQVAHRHEVILLRKFFLIKSTSYLFIQYSGYKLAKKGSSPDPEQESNIIASFCASRPF